MKAYLILNYDVTDSKKLQDYREAAAPILIEKYGAKRLAYDDNVTSLEGNPGQSTVMLGFDSYTSALTAYNSPEYQQTIPGRVASTDNRRVFIIRGIDS